MYFFLCLEVYIYEIFSYMLILYKFYYFIIILVFNNSCVVLYFKFGSCLRLFLIFLNWICDVFVMVIYFVLIINIMYFLLWYLCCDWNCCVLIWRDLLIKILLYELRCIFVVIIYLCYIYFFVFWYRLNLIFY